MVYIFVFSTSNYTLWNKKIFKNQMALKPKRNKIDRRLGVYIGISSMQCMHSAGHVQKHLAFNDVVRRSLQSTEILILSIYISI